MFPHTQSHVTLQAKLELQQTVMPTITTTIKQGIHRNTLLYVDISHYIKQAKRCKPKPSPCKHKDTQTKHSKNQVM